MISSQTPQRNLKQIATQYVKDHVARFLKKELWLRFFLKQLELLWVFMQNSS